MAQQVFYRVLKYRERFTGEGEFIHWMFAIARNVINDQGKRKKLPLHSGPIDDMADWVAGHTDLEDTLNVRVLIDDRPTYLSGENLANYLRSLTASQLNKITALDLNHISIADMFEI